ncbi:MAG: lysine-sensitive aspartokinase 3 [Acidobacteria bacterium]|nr:lysine-sensitive aspartokinase 3 [Acidobacteriota bacterium]
MIVMKFGGSSVADAACMRQVGALVRDRLDQAPLVVLSAMGKTTNALFDMARAAEVGDLPAALETLAIVRGAHRQAADSLCEGAMPEALDEALTEHFGELELRLRGVALLRELSPRSLDAIAAFGERLSTLVFAAWFGVERVDARQVLLTDATFGEAAPQAERIRLRAAEVIGPLLGAGRAVVTQGYIGATADGLTTTLGRGGSDYSAALFGAALGASEVQIWTDVEGVLTCDPRVVPEAQPIAELSFAEAAELAAFGAKVLHPATIQPAVEADIPVTVRHTLRPEGAFTTITGRVATGRPVTALATRGGLTVLTVSSTRMLHQPGFLAKLFEVFARHRVSVDLIATAEVSVSLTVEEDVPLEPLLADLRAFATVAVVRDRALVAVVGERLKATPGLAGKLFGALGDLNVEMISMGANEINLSLVVAASDAPRALGQLHRVLMAEPLLAGSGV